MNILLINCPIRLKDEPRNLPLGVGYLASVLINKGHVVEVLDINGKRLTPEEVKSFLSNNIKRWDLIGISGLVTTYLYQKWLINFIKELSPTIMVISGGGLASSVPHLLFERTMVDVVVIGEGENTILEVAEVRSLEEIPGIWFRKNGLIQKNPSRSLIENLDAIPFPAYELLLMEKYLKNPIWGFGKRSINLITSRGCPFECTYCYHVFGKGSYRTRSPKNIIDEVRFVRKKYNVDFVAFVDDNMMSNRDRLLEFLPLIKEEKISWGCHGRVDAVDKKVICYMKKAGCIWIGYGIESGSQKILQIMNRKTTLAKIEKAIALTNEAGIYANASYIFGYPGEDKITIRETINLIKKLNLSHSPNIKGNLHFATPYPGTPLFDFCLKQKLIDNEEAYISRLDDATQFTINLTRMQDEELLELRDSSIAEIEDYYKSKLFIKRIFSAFFIRRVINSLRRNGLIAFFLKIILMPFRFRDPPKIVILLEPKEVTETGIFGAILKLSSYFYSFILKTKIFILKEKCAKIRVIDRLNDYFYPSMFNDIQENGVHLCTSWFKNPEYKYIREAFYYKGISLLDIWEMEFSYFGVDLIEKDEAIHKIVETEKPDILYLENSNIYNDIPYILLRKLGIKTKILAQFPYNLSNTTNKFLKKILKKDILCRFFIEDISNIQAGKIIFFPFSEGTIDSLIPIMEKIKDSLSIKSSIFAYKNWDISIFKRLETIQANIIRYCYKRGKINIEKKFSNILKNEAVLKVICKEIVYKGINISDIFIRGFKERLPESFSKSIAWIDNFSVLMEKVRPAFVYTVQDKMPIARAVTLVCKKLKIPIAVAHSGILEENPLITHMSISELSPKIRWDITADIWFLMGGALKQQLIENGVNTDRIHVVGMPKFDSIPDLLGVNRSPILKGFGFQERKKYILFSMQYPADQDRSTIIDRLEMLDAVLEEISDIPETIILLKPHPSSNPKEIISYKNHSNSQCIIVNKSTNIYKLIVISDLVITAFSTTALEAMIFQKPVIIVNLLKRPDPMPFVKEGLAFGVYDRSDIKNAIYNCLENKYMREKMIEGGRNFVKRHIYSIDGQASQRTLNIIRKLILNDSKM